MNSKVSNEGGKNLAVFIAGGKSCLKVFLKHLEKISALFRTSTCLWIWWTTRGRCLSWKRSRLTRTSRASASPPTGERSRRRNPRKISGNQVGIGLLWGVAGSPNPQVNRPKFVPQIYWHGTMLSTGLICLLSRFASLKWFWKPIQTYIYNNRRDYQLSSLSLSSLSLGQSRPTAGKA